MRALRLRWSERSGCIASVDIAPAMAAYAASFDDGHIFWGTNEKAPDAIVSWPSLLTGFDDSGAQIVRSRAKDAPVPLGAVLVGCDGMPANTLAARLVGDFVGRWMLSSQRMQLASLLFANDGNPFVVRPRRCTFRINGSARAVKLHWRVLSGREHAVEPFADPPRQPIGSRIFPDGTRWFSMSSFDGDPGGDVGKALVAMIVQMKQDRPALAAAPRIVLDLRRNGGGSSDWSYQIATILWGAAATDRQAQDGSWAEWRVSPANIDSVIEMRDERAAGGLSPEQLNYLNILIEGMKAAHAAGQPLWREPSDAYAPNANVPADTPPPQPLAGPVYVVTDSDCASACLDAVDPLAPARRDPGGAGDRRGHPLSGYPSRHPAERYQFGLCSDEGLSQSPAGLQRDSEAALSFRR